MTVVIPLFVVDEEEDDSQKKNGTILSIVFLFKSHAQKRRSRRDVLIFPNPRVLPLPRKRYEIGE